MSLIYKFSYEDGIPCRYGDFQITEELTEDLHLCSIYMEEYAGVAHLFTTENYAGTIVGQGFCYRDEEQICRLLAMARLLHYDYLWSEGND